MILLIVIVVTFFLLSRKGGSAAPPAGQPAPGAPSAAAAPAVEPAPASQAGAASTPPIDLNGLVGEELKKKQEELQKQYDAKAKELEKQIADAKKNGKPLPGAPAPPTGASTAPAASFSVGAMPNRSQLSKISPVTSCAAMMFTIGACRRRRAA